jgi:hypothetical protein
METLWNRFQNSHGTKYKAIEDDDEVVVSLKEPLICYEENRNTNEEWQDEDNTNKEDDYEDKYTKKNKKKLQSPIVLPTSFILTVEPKFLRSPNRFFATATSTTTTTMTALIATLTTALFPFRSCFFTSKGRRHETIEERALLRCMYLTLGLTFVLIAGVYQHAV